MDVYVVVELLLLQCWILALKLWEPKQKIEVYLFKISQPHLFNKTTRQTANQIIIFCG